MQTALQKLKTRLVNQKDFYGTRFPQFVMWIDELMQHEKETIEAAFDAGMNNSVDFYTSHSSGDERIPECEEYYKQTYKKS